MASHGKCVPDRAQERHAASGPCPSSMRVWSQTFTQESVHKAGKQGWTVAWGTGRRSAPVGAP